MYSLTKYMNGHSDVVMGAAITRRDDLKEKLRFLQNGKSARNSVNRMFNKNSLRKTFCEFSHGHRSVAF